MTQTFTRKLLAAVFVPALAVGFAGIAIAQTSGSAGGAGTGASAAGGTMGATTGTGTSATGSAGTTGTGVGTGAPAPSSTSSGTTGGAATAPGVGSARSAADQLFEQLDTNHDGVLSREEFARATVQTR